MKRRFTIFSALSLLGCVAVVVSWTLSYRAYDCLILAEVSDGYFLLVSHSGRIAIEREHYWGISRPSTPGKWWRRSARWQHTPNFIGYSPSWKRGGFNVDWKVPAFIDELPTRVLTQYGTKSSVSVPYWFLALLTLALPVLWGMRVWWLARRCRSRMSHGLCVSCAYDLRASHEKCPECGTPIPPDLVRKPLE